MSLTQLIKSKISIPKYFSKFIDSSIDLTEIKACKCPLHKDNNPSFTYSADKGLWRCWSNCGGGDVITLHQKFRRLKSRDEAIQSLKDLLNIDSKEVLFNRPEIKRNEVKDNLQIEVTKACRRATTPEDWIELDRLMGSGLSPTELTAELSRFNEGYDWE